MPVDDMTEKHDDHDDRHDTDEPEFQVVECMDITSQCGSGMVSSMKMLKRNAIQV